MLAADRQQQPDVFFTAQCSSSSGEARQDCLGSGAQDGATGRHDPPAGMLFVKVVEVRLDPS